MKTSALGPTTFEPYPYQLEALKMLEGRTPLPAKVIRISTPQISDEQKDAIRKAFADVGKALGSFTLVFDGPGGVFDGEALSSAHWLGSGVSMFETRGFKTQRLKEAFNKMVAEMPATSPTLFLKSGDSDAERARKRAINILGPRKGRWK